MARIFLMRLLKRFTHHPLVKLFIQKPVHVLWVLSHAAITVRQPVIHITASWPGAGYTFIQLSELRLHRLNKVIQALNGSKKINRISIFIHIEPDALFLWYQAIVKKMLSTAYLLLNIFLRLLGSTDNSHRNNMSDKLGCIPE